MERSNQDFIEQQHNQQQVEYFIQCSGVNRWLFPTKIDIIYVQYNLVMITLLQAMIEKQDEQLEDVGQSVQTLKQMGVAIGNELDEQAV